MDDLSGLEARLQQLLAKRGQELVRGLIDEVTNLHREIAGLRRELAALSDYQGMRDRWLVLDGMASRPLRLPRVAIMEPDQLLRPRDGFYPQEYTSNGTPFRWTGPTPQFSFDVFVDRSLGADLKLEALNCIDYERQSKLSLLADGEQVPLEVAPEGSGFVATAALSKRDDARSSNLIFVLPAVLPPPESSDPRVLGIAFGRLTVAARSEKGIAPEMSAAPPQDEA